MANPMQFGPVELVEARSVAIRTLNHERLEARGVSCAPYHHRNQDPINPRLSSACQVGTHEQCRGQRVATAPAHWWYCRCLCHQARDYWTEVQPGMTRP